MSKLDALRMQVLALEGRHVETCEGDQILPFEDSRLNTPLPHGGLKLGALHEFLSDGLEAELAPAVTAFVATAAARILRIREGYALWALSRADCYAPGLARFGLEPSRIIWVECRKDAEVLGIVEEALHSRALAVVVGEAGTLSLKAGRRLDAAARQSDVTALFLRRPLFKSSKAGCSPSGAATTRWRVSALPTADLDRFSPHPVLLPQGEKGRRCNGRDLPPLPTASACGCGLAGLRTRQGVFARERAGVRGVKAFKHFDVYGKENEIGHAGEVFPGRLGNLRRG
jgi:protein ImuA